MTEQEIDWITAIAGAFLAAHVFGPFGLLLACMFGAAVGVLDAHRS